MSRPDIARAIGYDGEIECWRSEARRVNIIQIGDKQAEVDDLNHYFKTPEEYFEIECKAALSILPSKPIPPEELYVIPSRAISLKD